MTRKNNFILVVMLVSSFAVPSGLFAQSDSIQEAIPITATRQKQEEKPEAKTETATNRPLLEKVKLINSGGIYGFINELNANGKLGYRLYKSVNYGGEGVGQSYAAVLRLDPGNRYEYDFLSSPNKKLLEGRLNAQAMIGFNYATAYALTACSEDLSEDSSITSVVLRLGKGDAFLLERKNDSKEQAREYKVFIAKVHLGDSAEKTIQKGIEDATAQGFRPVKILFARQGLLDFSVSVLVERDLPANHPPEAEYRFLKKTSGLPKDVNALAAQGFRFITGRRVGSIGMVLMGKHANDASTYTFIDAKKYAKEFDKTVALGNGYQGVMAGDLTCGSTAVESEKLVFAQNASGHKYEYKIFDLVNDNAGSPSTESLAEFLRLLSESYQVKDLFYSGGVKVIFEK